MRTKWDVLWERRIMLHCELKRLADEMDAMERKAFGKPCSGCGELLATEADFAQHFLVPNETYLNLGECPNKGR